MTTRLVDGQAAWRSLAGQEDRQWKSAAARFGDGVLPVQPQVKFALSADDVFFCIGSCFARNVEEHLIYRGINVASKAIVAPLTESSARPNGLVNKYTTMSMVNEVRWVNSPLPDWSQTILDTPDGAKDMQLAPTLRPVTLERAIERRRYISSEYFARIRTATVVVVTLGLNEVWFDHEQDLYLNGPPSLWSARRAPGRYSVAITDAQANIEALETFYAELQIAAPGVRIIITVSPVPMGATFSGVDVAIANSYSKSVLRAAAGAFADAHDDVAYFPSYEMITLGPRQAMYGSDCLHVRDEAVSVVMDTFFATYLDGRPHLEPGFVEMAYLDAHSDVEEQVRAGQWQSGFAHWRARGREEGRAMRAETASARMDVLGIG